MTGRVAIATPERHGSGSIAMWAERSRLAAAMTEESTDPLRGLLRFVVADITQPDLPAVRDIVMDTPGSCRAVTRTAEDGWLLWWSSERGDASIVEVSDEGDLISIGPLEIPADVRLGLVVGDGIGNFAALGRPLTESGLEDHQRLVAVLYESGTAVSVDLAPAGNRRIEVYGLDAVPEGEAWIVAAGSFDPPDATEGQLLVGHISRAGGRLVPVVDATPVRAGGFQAVHTRATGGELLLSSFDAVEQNERIDWIDPAEGVHLGSANLFFGGAFTARLLGAVGTIPGQYLVVWAGWQSAGGGTAVNGAVTAALATDFGETTGGGAVLANALSEREASESYIWQVGPGTLALAFWRSTLEVVQLRCAMR